MKKRLLGYQGLHGDSGGIVFMHATNSTYAAVGVHSGTGESANVTKALNILNAFDVWIY